MNLTDNIRCVKTEELFDCGIEYLKGAFVDHEYPWDILPEIRVLISALLETGIKGFTKVRDNMLVGENVRIADSAVIEGNVILGHGTEVRPGAYIRGNVITGPDCVIGNSTELKNCILLEHVQVPHYNYVGDSILGNYAHMGAGAVCSNLKSDGKSVVIHGERDLETGLRKIGAFLGDRADIGCGCVLNPGTVIGKVTSVYPMTAVRGVIPSGMIVKAMNDIVVRE
ncbi:MAG: UDP-N-acetylglucosamine pyrophosphorylase [Clostridia bacterium]|nr:UDP-N-acetylglucosamine pyrophosphorylase [Clostridia bacterium]